jgi:hypothetical protein
MCSQLEVQAKSDAELNRVCQARASFLLLTEDAIGIVWVEIKEKNREGLVRWYPVCGTESRRCYYCEFGECNRGLEDFYRR